MRHADLKTPSALAIPTINETAAFFSMPSRNTPVLVKAWDENEVGDDQYFSPTSD